MGRDVVALAPETAGPEPTRTRDPAPSVWSRASAPSLSSPTLQRLQETAGNAAVTRLLTLQTKLGVSEPGDPLERAADGVASRVLSGAPATTVLPARLPGATGVARAPEAVAPAGTAPTVSPSTEALVAGASGGEPLPAEVRSRVEAEVGADLGAARVHTGPEAARAAAELGARAFTHGADIFLGAGESADDVALMAHEATHVVQQGAAGPVAAGAAPGGAPSAPAEVARKIDGTDIPGAGVVVSAIQAIPGYSLMTLVIGEDPITGQAVANGRAEIVQTLLGYGPFAGAVGPVLQAMDALDQVFTLVHNRLGEHNLTLARIEHDVGAAWDEIHIVDGIDANVAVVRRYVDAFVADVRAFAAAVAADVIAAVRAAAVAFAEPLVQSPEIKPYWDLGTKVFHYDPLKGQPVSAPTVEIISDFLKLIHKEQALAQMQERGTLQKTADWLDTQFATFSGLLAQTSALFSDAWAAIAPENLPNLVSNIESLAQRAYALLQSVGAFATTVITQVLILIKDSLLGWLSDQAHHTRGFELLTVILGKDPFTDAVVPRTPENLIKGFITLLPGGEQTYAQLAQSGVIADAAGRIETAMTQLGISWELITGTFHAIWDALSLEDLLNPIGAAMRIIDQFGEPLGRIVSFVATVVGVVIELVLRLMNFPSDLLGDIIAQTQAAVEDIENDPVQFLRNVVLALKQGVAGFLDKIGTYLLQGLADWLFHGLRGLGIQPPADLSVGSVITFVLQVIGVSEETLWRKLGNKIGPERVAQIRSAIAQLGQAWQFVKDVQERGISAIWEFVTGQLSGLWDMILQRAKDWIMTEIVNKVAARLLSMLDPTGVMAIINSCVAFFRAVQSAIEYLRDILQIVDRYVSTFAAIAKGDVGPGATMMEQGLAGSVPVAIGFLANQVGLGDAPEKVVDIIKGLQELVDQALDWLFDQAWRLGQAALEALGLGSQQDSEKPGDVTGVKAAAHADLAAAAAQPLDSREQLQVILDQIMSAHQDQGLKSLEVRSAPALGHFTVLAEASPLDPIGQVINHPGAPPAPETAIEMALDMVSGQTHCFAEFGPAGGAPEHDEHYQNVPQGLHAEQVFLNDLEHQLGLFPKGAIVPVRIKLNRLPCPVCAPALNGTASANSSRMTLHISATAIYGGSTTTAWLIEGSQVKMKPDKYIKAKRQEIENLLSNPNVTLDVWDIWSVISASLLTDARLQALDPALVEQNLRAGSQLQGYLEYVRNSIGPSFSGLRARRR